jgi:hypothetical protein
VRSISSFSNEACLLCQPRQLPIKTINARAKTKKGGLTGVAPNRTGDIYQGFITAKFQSHKDLIMQKEIRDFLESITSHNTRKGYLRGLSLFEEFSGRSLQETLRLRKKDKERNLEREVERFYTWIIEVKKLNPNTAYNCVVALKSLMTFYNASLKLKRGSCSARAVKQFCCVQPFSV